VFRAFAAFQRRSVKNSAAMMKIAANSKRKVAVFIAPGADPTENEKSRPGGRLCLAAALRA